MPGLALKSEPRLAGWQHELGEASRQPGTLHGIVSGVFLPEFEHSLTSACTGHYPSANVMARTKDTAAPALPVLDLSAAEDPDRRSRLLEQLHDALFNVGFLYISNHGVPQETINHLTGLMPALFALPDGEKGKLSKMNSPHFLGYSGYAKETTLGQQDLREQFDLATELPVVYESPNDVNGGSGSSSDGRDFSKLYWRLRGPNQWPEVPGFKEAFIAYHDALQELSYRFVHLIEEAFAIPVGTFDHFFGRQQHQGPPREGSVTNGKPRDFLPPQHRIKLLRYPPASMSADDPWRGQGVGAHKDSSGWLTFLYQVGNEIGLSVLNTDDEGQRWINVPPVPGTFVVNFGNAFEAATEGAVRATTHRVISPGPFNKVRYSIPFFQGLPLDMTVSEIRQYIPEHVRSLRRIRGDDYDDGGVAASFLDPRWDSLGESQLRKWIRSHKDVGLEWYGKEVVDYYTS